MGYTNDVFPTALDIKLSEMISKLILKICCRDGERFKPWKNNYVFYITYRINKSFHHEENDEKCKQKFNLNYWAQV